MATNERLVKEIVATVFGTEDAKPAKRRALVLATVWEDDEEPRWRVSVTAGLGVTDQRPEEHDNRRFATVEEAAKYAAAIACEWIMPGDRNRWRKGDRF